MDVNESEILEFVEEGVPGFESTGRVERLEEGLTNRVWRIFGRVRSVVVKHAPPFIASRPDVELDASRLEFESRVLEAVGPEGRLSELGRPEVRAPELLASDLDRSLIAIEDLGETSSLGDWLVSAPSERSVPAAEVGGRVGAYIGRLHARTAEVDEWADRHFNRPIQETRRAVQYEPTAELLREHGVENAGELGRWALEVGESFCRPGHCLVMGDLWPSSIRLAPPGVRVIDWEFSTYGRSVQDTAHLWAHLWMLEEIADDRSVRGVEAFRSSFAEDYCAETEDVGAGLRAQETLVDGAVHAACEVLARTLGAFSETGPLARSATSPNQTDRAVAAVVEALDRPEGTQFVEVFGE